MKSEIENKIDLLIEEEKKLNPSLFLAAKVEAGIFTEKKQVWSQTYFPVFQQIVAGLIILFCAALGVFSVNNTEINDMQSTEMEHIYFNEMKIEYPESILLK